MRQYPGSHSTEGGVRGVREGAVYPGWGKLSRLHRKENIQAGLGSMSKTLTEMTEKGQCFTPIKQQ